MEEWTTLWEKFNYNVVDWWKKIVKPCIREAAILKTKEWNKSRYGILNMLIMKQLYFNKKTLSEDENAKIKLCLINLDIKKWFTTEARAAILHINTQEIEESENMKP